MDTNSLRTQLSPQWSGVNVAITIVLFLFFWPLAVAMAAYVIWGQKFGLNLAQPHTFVSAGQRLSRAFGKGAAEFKQTPPRSDADWTNAGGTPAADASVSTREGFDQWRNDETRRLNAEREALDLEKSAFLKEKAAWQAARD